MKVAELVSSRKVQWEELEQGIRALGSRRWRRPAPDQVLRFGELYRAACADLALAQAYRLPEDTVRYLHQLVARAHNVLYRSERFRVAEWGRILFVEVPSRLFRDVYLRIALALFWSLFLGAGLVAFTRPEFARQIVGEATLVQMEEMYSKPMSGRDSDMGSVMAGYYMYNNTSIGLRCFAGGIFLGIGSMMVMAFNAIFLGAIFGHMAGTSFAENFFNFVTAHGPFELTAVALSAAAGLRLGFSVVDTRGLSRGDSLRRQAPKAFEIAAVAAILFFLAAFIEAYISPSALPYSVKAGVAVTTALLLVVYIVVLGWKEATTDAA